MDPRTGSRTDLGKSEGGKYLAKLPTDTDTVLVIQDRNLTKR